MLGVFGPYGPRVQGVVCQLVFNIGIVYIMPTIGGIRISCWVSLGPSGPEQGGCMSVGVYIGIVYIVPTIGGLYVGCCLH